MSRQDINGVNEKRVRKDLIPAAGQEKSNEEREKRPIKSEKLEYTGSVPKGKEKDAANIARKWR